MNKEGKLITIMGINNVGKTTQQILIQERLKNEGYSVISLKYPLYELQPTGPRCNNFLRNGNPEKLTALEFQELCAQNRFDFQEELLNLLENNDFVIAEMYTGSGIAFGMGDNISYEKLKDMNIGLIIPDTSILLDGKRFLEAREEGHNFEKDDVKMDKIREHHLFLAEELKWSIVDANQSIELVSDKIFNLIK